MLPLAWRRRLANSQIRAFLAVLGPGIIAASAGNDAGGVLTYSQAGAYYQYRLLWVLFFLTFSLAIAQEMGARMAAVTGKGLADLIREEFGVKTTVFAMVALIIANISTTVAEFAGIVAVSEMFLPKTARFIVVPIIAIGVWLLVVRGTYRRVERIFLMMCAVYLSYVIAAFVARPQWGDVLRQTVVPDFSKGKPDGQYVQMVIALVGTTVAPWMQFYVQSSVRDKGISAKDYPLERVDVLSGAILSNLISFFMVVTCAATLFARQIRVDTAENLAQALGFLGKGGQYLFALGLFNAAMVGAVAVPLSTAYAVTEALGWESGLGRRIREAPLFIGVYSVVIVMATAVILFSRSSPLSVILISQVINGMLLPVILVLMLRLINKPRLMGEHTNSRYYNFIAGTTVVLVTILSVVFLGFQIHEMFA
jgi:Mn2+/Fe2+ NRAMP family transporter